MATIQQAVQAAAAFARETLGPDRTSGLQLEEVESGQVNGEDAWLITLSMMPSPEFSTKSAADALFARREYKVFGVSKETAEVMSMRIRELVST